MVRRRDPAPARRQMDPRSPVVTCCVPAPGSHSAECSPDAARRTPPVRAPAPRSRVRPAPSSGRCTPTTSRSPRAWRPRRARPCGCTTGRVHQRVGGQELLQEVQLQVLADDLQHDGRGAGQAFQRTARIRRLLPDRRCARPAGRGQDDPAAQPQLHPQHGQRLAGLSESVLRPGLAVHDAVLDLHHGDGLAQGQGEPRARRGTCRGRGRRTRARWPSSTITGRRSAWRFCGPATWT